MNRLIVAAAVVALAGCEVNLNSEGVVVRETKRFSVTGVPDVVLDTFYGSVEVHSWDRNEIEVEIEKRAMEQALVDEMKVTAEQQGDRVVVKVAGPNRSDGFGGVQIGVHFSPSARLRVALPRNSQLTASSGDGSLVVEDVNGKLTLRTADGSVRASGVSGTLTVRTSDGSIRLDRAEGALDLETDDGSITIDAKPSALRARTADGSIRFEISPDAVMSDDWTVQTDDGTITLTLPATFNALLDAETREGVVRSTYGGLQDNTDAGEGESRESRQQRRRVLKATLGTGGHTLRVRSGDGSIRIE